MTPHDPTALFRRQDPQRRRSALRVLSATVVTGALLSSGALVVSSSFATGSTSALVLADTNRDGQVTTADAEGRGTWTKDSGAFFLANLDDDAAACPTIGSDGTQLSDVALASCNDAADRVVNGDSDVRDLARVQVKAVDTSKVDTVRVELRGVGATKVNVFVKRGTGAKATDWTPLAANGVLPADLVANGVELGVEGKDIIRDASWDGTVTLHVVHRSGGKKVASDSVEMRVAPVLFATDRMPIEKLYMSDNETSVYEGQTTPEPAANLVRTQKAAEYLTSDFLAGLERIGKGVSLEKLPSLQGARGGGDGTDIWLQDVTEPGLMSIPGPDGEQQMRVFVRAPVRDGRDNAGANPLRQTGRVIFTHLRGPDVAAVQHLDPAYEPAMIPGQSYDTRGSTGNYGTVPAYEHDGKKYPLGRKVYGAVPGTGFTADPAFNEMLDRQGFQDPIAVDTSWLSVGHIDEFMSIIPADNDRGWALVVADPKLAMDLLQELVDAGRGGEQLYTPYGLEAPAGSAIPDLTVAQALAGKEFVDGTRIGHAGVSKGVKVLTKEVGLTEDDIIRVPVLYKANAHGRVGVQVPNAANLIGTGHDVVFVPTQHVPSVDGKDLFQAEIEKRFAEIGTEVSWAEDFFYTNRGGQIHCVTNYLRDTTYGDAWWTEGAAKPSGGDVAKTFSTIVQPSVSGTFQPGRTITVNPGTVSPAPQKVTYQWYRGTNPIPGATSRTLTLKKEWGGDSIRVGIISSSTGFTTLSSVTTIGALPKSFKAKKVKISGKFAVGKTLKATSPVTSKSATLSYQWRANGKAVKGATGKSLKLTSKFKGKKISVVVTAKKSGYVTHKAVVSVSKGKRLR